MHHSIINSRDSMIKIGSPCGYRVSILLSFFSFFRFFLPTVVHVIVRVKRPTSIPQYITAVTHVVVQLRPDDVARDSHVEAVVVVEDVQVRVVVAQTTSLVSYAVRLPPLIPKVCHFFVARNERVRMGQFSCTHAGEVLQGPGGARYRCRLRDSSRQ